MFIADGVSFEADPIRIVQAKENESGDGPYRSPRQIAVERFRYLEDGRIAPIVMTP